MREAAAVTFSPLLLSAFEAKQHGSYNIYIGVHFTVSEERWELRAGFFSPSGVGGDTDRLPQNTVGFSSIGLKSRELRRRAFIGKSSFADYLQDSPGKAPLQTGLATPSQVTQKCRNNK